MSIGKNLRSLLKERSLKLTHIEEMSGVSYTDIRNILHDRSQNMEKIGKIVKALDVPLEAIIPITLDNQAIDVAIYCRVINCIHKVLENRKNIIKKQLLDELIVTIYTYADKNKNETDEKLTGFTEGVIKSTSSLLP